jgi:hypothetical protein
MGSALHPDVKAAVLTWVGTEDLRSASVELAKSVARLSVAQREQLVERVSRIMLDTLLELLAKTDLEKTDKTIEWSGFTWHPKQIDRLVTWGSDLQRTGKALSLSKEQFTKALESAIAYLQEQGRAQQAGPSADAYKRAKKFLGMH